MKYTIEWIGTGAGLNPELSNTSMLIKSAHNQLNIDFGSLIPSRLLANGRLKETTDIAITHLHADHIGGLEILGFMHYFAYKNRAERRPRIYLASDSMAEKLWHTLKEGMETGQHFTKEILTLHEDYKHNFEQLLTVGVKTGLYVPFQIRDYFDIHIGSIIKNKGLPKTKFIPTIHAPFMECYAMRIGRDGQIYFSGDSIEMPPNDPKIIFQDCQFFKGGIHAAYDDLKCLPNKIKKKTYLTHLGATYNTLDPVKDGFAGFVKPGDIFEFRE